MKDENYICIQGWMRNKLNLTGNDLLVYAIIYGFSQEDNQKFTGGLQYLADWCGATKQGILKNIKSLMDKELITKTTTDSRVEYSCIPLNIVERSIKQSLTAVKQSLPNNIVNKQSISKDIDLKEKNINNFEFGKHTQPKMSLYHKCVTHIIQFTKNDNTSEVKNLLLDFLDSLVEMKKLRGERQFVGILNKLKEYGETESQRIKIIKNSIEHGYGTFYELNDYKTSNKVSSDMGRTVKRASKEVKEAIRNGTGNAEKF